MADMAKTARGKGVVVTGRRESSETGAAILRAGGNAIDAVVAAGFMEAVIAPAMCGIGGYGASGVAFLARERKTIAIDANAVAPAAAKPSMFPTIPGREPNAYIFPDSRHKQGPLSVGVPGVLDGLLTIQEKFGKLDRRAVIAPAERRAREGVAMTAGGALTWLTMEAKAEGRDVPRRSELPEMVKMPMLADTLQAIAEEGRGVFYGGRVGHAIANHIRELGGILTDEDMASYRAQVVEPVSVTMRGHALHTPPPASGGLSALQMVGLLDRLERAGELGRPGSASAFEAWLEIDKVVWTERLMKLADARFMERPPASLLTDEHLAEMLERVRAGLETPGPGFLIAPDPLRGTAHLAAADAEGNLVSWTQTHGGGYGSGVMARGTGIVLGHGMCRFEPRTGWANSVAPGKRPLHNMCPVVAVRDGRAVFAFGATGGRTIVNNVGAVAGWTLLGVDPVVALAAPRVQCESLEPAVMERAAGAAVLKSLLEKGHEVKEANRDAGTVHLIARSGDAWQGAGEPRAATSHVAAV